MLAERVFKLFYMPNFKLEELLAKSDAEIRSIAQTLGIAPNSTDTRQDIAYMIIDEQAVQNAQSVGAPRRTKRPRIGETVAKSAGKKKVAPTATAAGEPKSEPAPKTDAPADAAPVQAEAEVQSAPKRRGRPRKDATAEVAKPAVAEEAPAQPAEPKRRGRPRKNAQPVAEAPAEAASLFDEEQPAAVPVVAGEPAPAEEQPVKAAAEEESDFIILQDIPAPELIDQILSESPHLAANAQPSARRVQESAPMAAHQLAPAVPAERKGSYSGGRDASTPYDFGEAIIGSGVLEITPEGQGFLRSADYNYLTSPDDIFVPPQVIKAHGLKMGDVVEGPLRAPRENERVFTLMRVAKINGLAPDKVRDRLAFEHLTPLFPNEKFRLCKGDSSDSLSARVVDLFAPIGKGQRALLVAQPKTGKTMLMKSIANAIAANHPEAYLMMLLIDERPEEVTDMARTVKAEVIASTFDEPASNHVRIAGIVLEKAKRMVECGHDVVIFLDSITRLARAYNTVAPASGKILTGGVDANALQKPKRFFGAARNIEGGGSLTIIATALIDTGSRMDEVIFEEFKGTGNMELQLDRTLSNKRIFPAVNCVASSTRRDDLLHDKRTLDRMWVLRNHIAEMTAMEAMNVIKDRMERSKNNEEFLLAMNS